MLCEPAPRGGQEVRGLDEDVLVVALLAVADAAERVGPVPRVAAAPVDQQRAALRSVKREPEPMKLWCRFE